ncbi:hypothetical protein M3204_15875 [Mesobacillus subterraneus]|uniref:hypothetical protein n=1 Tax=Mesobacillus subterraneus TaxID=285983 RepID=UPI00203BC97A|nr:hypothetical protein [Mesobacillus subterraneus]MCM3665894.1 hypothetical protein [Mesobacillus subterraneus]MCM3684715.1 hypothetical protein [Mesobacillus subterraneus]
MFGIFKRKKLIKDDLKGIATLMYRDVSDDPWDKENLTKRNLDFSIESIRYIDRYTTRLMNTDMGKGLLEEHFDVFVSRIGAYIGEVIKENTRQDFDWYEFESVATYTSKLDGVYKSIETESLLYSKDRDTVIFPMLPVSQFLQGNSTYPNFLTFVVEQIKQNS